MLDRSRRLFPDSGMVMGVVGLVFVFLGVQIVSEKFDMASVIIGCLAAAMGGIVLVNMATSGVSRTPAGVRVRWLFAVDEYPGSAVTEVRVAREAHDIVPWDLIFPQIVLSSGDEIDLKFLGSYWLGRITERHVEKIVQVIADWCDEGRMD